jgi:hypothetical protein
MAKYYIAMSNLDRIYIKTILESYNFKMNQTKWKFLYYKKINTAIKI